VTRSTAVRALVSAALVASLGGCNLLKSQEDQPEAPPGTIVIPPDEARDLPKDAAGQPVDKGEGPVLQALGNIAAVDLGQRKGGCTFQHSDGRDLLVTGAPADQGVAGVGAIRTQGVIVMLQTAGAVGLDGLKAGPKLSNGAVTVQVVVGKKAVADGAVTRTSANLGITDKSGKQRLYSPGTWICA